jgi:hypothetical protein
MNVFNRIVIILLILAAMILIPMALILPEQAESVLRYGADVIRANLEWIDGLAPSARVGMRLLLSAIGMVVFLLGLLFLALEIVRIRRKTVRLVDGSGELMMDSVSGHLAYYIDTMPDVLRVKPSVRSRGKSVRASLYVETLPGVSVIDKSNEINATARQILEDELGLNVDGDIKVVIKPVPYPKGHRRTTRPAPAPAKAEPVEVTPVPEVAPVVEAPPPPEVPPAEEVETAPESAEEETDQEDQLFEAKGP